MLAYPYGIEFYRSHSFPITPFYKAYKNPCAKTVWLFLDSIRAGICFAFMLLSKNNTNRDKNKHPFLSWMLILPDFKCFVKTLNFYKIQGCFTINFSGVF